MNRLETIMNEKGMPTLKAIAGVFDLQAVRLYTVAKQPKEGVVYDAKVYNWDAIEKFIERRLDAEKGLATLEDVIAKALEIDEELKAQDGRRKESAGSAHKVEVDGKMVAERKYENFEQSAGQFVALKKDPKVYAIVLQTLSHTVLRAVKSDAPGPDFDFDSNEVTVISNGMLNMKGVGPANLEQALAERFSGEFAKKLAEEALKAVPKTTEEATAE